MAHVIIKCLNPLMGAIKHRAQLGFPYKGQRVDCLLDVTYYLIVGVRVSHPISYSGFSNVHYIMKENPTTTRILTR